MVPTGHKRVNSKACRVFSERWRPMEKNVSLWARISADHALVVTGVRAAQSEELTEEAEASRTQNCGPAGSAAMTDRIF